MFLLTAHSSIPSYVPAVAQIMASRSAHTEKRERRGDGGGRLNEGGERREERGEGGGCEEKLTACIVKRKKEDIEKGKGGADRDNEKGKRREQKALAVRRSNRMRNVCAVLGGGVQCVFGRLCVRV